VPRLFAWLLNGVYLGLLLIAAPWIVWTAVRRGKYREGFAQKLLGLAPRRRGDRPCVWLHAVSVGEVNLLATTINELKLRSPRWQIVISTTTKTGYDLAIRKYADYIVFYCPLDFSWAVRSAIERVRPNLLVLAELELWPNLIRAAKEHGARVAIINARLSTKSFRGYRRIRPLVASVLRHIDLIAAQNEETAERFRKLGADHQAVHLTGSVKFDGAQTDRSNSKTRELQALAKIAASDVVFLAGSTQEPEEAYALAIFQALSANYPALRLVLVPRHPHRFDEVAQLLNRSGLPWQRRTDLESETPSKKTANSRDATHRRPPRILLVNTIGELGAWWGTATIGFVGGSFGPRGGQNMLEPAAYGVATSFGPNTRNFRDIVAQLLAVDGAVVVRDQDALEHFVRRALEDPPWAQSLGNRARELVLSQQGATQRTVDWLDGLMEPREAQANAHQDAA